MGFILKFCPIKALCSIGIWRVKDEEAIGYVEMDAKSTKAMHFIKLTKQYKELALIARDAGKFLGRRAVTMWENGEEDLSEWTERRGDGLCQFVDFYERGVIKLKRLLVELIETSGEPLTVDINWGMWWLLLLLFIGSFETPFASPLLTFDNRVVWRRVGVGISAVHSTSNALISSGDGLLCDVSSVLSVKSLLELEQEVDWCRVVVWCITERNSSL